MLSQLGDVATGSGSEKQHRPMSAEHSDFPTTFSQSVFLSNQLMTKCKNEDLCKGSIFAKTPPWEETKASEGGKNEGSGKE